MVLSTDATSGVTTHAATRFLSLGVPDADGAVTLDSTGRRTCRAPTPTWPPVRFCPRGTTFPVAVEAGERIPDERLEESTRA